jgi:hypothetical protein
MNEQTAEAEHNREVSNMCFEYFKHFTTVSTAAALVELALCQHFDLDLETILLALFLLGAALVISVSGMFFIPFRAGVGTTFSHSGTLNIVHQLMFITAFLLVTNFIAFTVGTFDISGLWLVPFLILSVLLGVGMAVFYRRSMPPERVQFPRSLPAIYQTVSLGRPVNRGNHLLGVSFLPTICLTRMFWHHRSEQLRGD